MSSQRNSTRQRLIDAALELFTSQGVTETTTRQIAELAHVNEVTLFRHFGNKYGLLLAVIEDSAVFTQLGESLVEQANQSSSVSQALKDYARGRLQALSSIPELVRSLVGEAGQYSAAHRQALGQGFTQANRYVAEYLATVIHRGQLHTRLSPEKLASLLNGMLLGYFVIELTSEFHEPWDGRDDFLENLVELFLHGAVSPVPESLTNSLSHVTTESSSVAMIEKVVDLPDTLVHSILQRAKKQGLQDYALAYVLLGAGLSVAEIINLERSHQICEPQQHLLQISNFKPRQVPINQWILGKRYGSPTRNPLTQWLKSRKDNKSALFINDTAQPLSEADLHGKWQIWTEGMLTPEGQPPTIEQAQQTWCIEMLRKGIDLEDLSILSGLTSRQLQPFVRRAREKAALEQANRLDHKV